MGLTLNRGAYQRMIDEDIEEIVKTMPDSLERRHIIDVLKRSVGLYYDELPGSSSKNGAMRKKHT